MTICKRRRRDARAVRQGALARQHGHVVVCDETGAAYFSVAAVAYVCGVTKGAVYAAIKTGCAAANLHWHTALLAELPDDEQVLVNKAIDHYLKTGEFVYERVRVNEFRYATHGISDEKIKLICSLLVDDDVRTRFVAGELGLTEPVRIRCSSCGKTLYKTVAHHLQATSCHGCATRARYTAARAAAADTAIAALIFDETQRRLYMSGQCNGNTKVTVTCDVCGKTRGVLLRDLIARRRVTCHHCVTSQMVLARRKSDQRVLDALIDDNDKQAYIEGTLKDRNHDAAFRCACGGSFRATVHQFLYDGKTRCTKCVQRMRRFVGKEGEIVKCIRGFLPTGTKVKLNTRDVLQPGRKVQKELDVYVPSCQIGVEYNGLFWHKVSSYRPLDYHRRKFIMAENVGVHVVNVFEHEWRVNKQQCIDRLRGLFASLPLRRVDFQLTVNGGVLFNDTEAVAECVVTNNIMIVYIRDARYNGDVLLWKTVDMYCRITKTRFDSLFVYVDHNWWSGACLRDHGWRRVRWLDNGCWFYGKHVYTDKANVSPGLIDKVMYVPFVGVGCWKCTC